MGLGITAAQKAERLEPQPEPDANGEWADELYDGERFAEAFAYEGFGQSLTGLSEPISNGAILYSGWYRLSGEIFQFGTTYTGHGMFRAALAEAALGVSPERIEADADSYRTQPFFEFIHFADNEGTIGPAACADLAADFREQRDLVMPILPADEELAWLRELYDNWQRAFELAAGTGIVVFH
jgi:hypothetical protein